MKNTSDKLFMIFEALRVAAAVAVMIIGAALSVSDKESVKETEKVEKTEVPCQGHSVYRNTHIF